MYSFERGRTTRAISIGFTAQQPVLVSSRKRLGPPPPGLETLAVLMDLHWESVRTDLHTNTQAERNRKRVAHEIDLLPTARREGFFSRDRPPAHRSSDRRSQQTERVEGSLLIAQNETNGPGGQGFLLQAPRGGSTLPVGHLDSARSKSKVLPTSNARVYAFCSCLGFLTSSKDDSPKCAEANHASTHPSALACSPCAP